MRAIVIGIAGGTGSGKTTVAHKIASYFSPDEVVLVDQDSYYNDLSHLDPEERKRINFDHPDAFDTPLLMEHILLLKNGSAVDKPIYSYKLHCRTDETARVEPAQVILLEGILVLESEVLRRLMDVKIFVDTEDDIRLIRRLRRDIRERGRDLENVIIHYERTVRPMHLGFILPSKRYADVVIPRGGENDVAIRMVVATVREQLRQNAERRDSED
ncbi:MAG TPA: uridine kinase [Myxococcales bacterium]|nr:uridine kinase [Deltaproteobacteria bacterium]MBU49680.1 uridine kinase [Deltaproteobacteria bacterium]HAA58967.1 uridine kinase [Myxococcales bacterium]|tara:strand:+ start:1294 stop:1938 length:645 start_codon:yes stop_codon:yes gene_type:complete